MKSERLPPFGDGRLSEGGMKKSVTQVRLEEIKTKVKQGEDLTCWNKLPRKLVDFQSFQNKLWKLGFSSTQGTGPSTRAVGEKQVGYDIKIRLNKLKVPN